MPKLKGAAAKVVCLANPFEDPGVRTEPIYHGYRGPAEVRADAAYFGNIKSAKYSLPASNVPGDGFWGSPLDLDPYDPQSANPDPINRNSIRDVPEMGRDKPAPGLLVDPSDSAFALYDAEGTLQSAPTGEEIHFSDPTIGELGTVHTVAPNLRRELRRHRNDLMYGEISRVTRDFDAFRGGEFQLRGVPPAPGAFHANKNTRALKYDGAHALDHDRVGVAEQLLQKTLKDAADYEKRLGAEVTAQEFEGFLTNAVEQAHDKATTQHSQLRTEEDKRQRRHKLEEIKALQSLYRENLQHQAIEARKLVFCREPQIQRTYAGIYLNPIHTDARYYSATSDMDGIA